jgi:hypothetical protein
MNLKGIISIAGKPGLYKVVSSGKNTLIVESLTDGKRFPAFSSHKVSTLEDISMYTSEEDVPLGDIIGKIFEKEKGGPCIDAKAEPPAHHAYFEEILPNYDKERVHNSDLRKLFSWYNILQESGTLKTMDEEAKALEAETEEKPKKAKKKAEGEEKTSEKTEKKPKAKKTATGKEKKPASTDKLKASSKAKTTTRKSTSTKRGA